MGLEDIAAAMTRVKTVLARRPDMGIHDDAPATARWEKGTRIVSSHENGTQVATDMPTEFGGSGDQVSPGWLFRAGMASCTATTIAMVAAEQGIELTALEIKAVSRSDSRGFLALEEKGALVYPGPGELQMHVKIAARNATPERLRKLVEESNTRAPICSAVKNASPVALRIEIEGA